MLPVSVWILNTELKHDLKDFSSGLWPCIKKRLSCSHFGSELRCTTFHPASHTRRMKSSHCSIVLLDTWAMDRSWRSMWSSSVATSSSSLAWLIILAFWWWFTLLSLDDYRHAASCNLLFDKSNVLLDWLNDWLIIQNSFFSFQS